MENIVPLLDNASCSVILIVVLWRFDATVRYLAEMMKETTDRMLEIIGKDGDEDG